MKYYDNRDNFRERIHTIRVTLQSGEYKGYIAYKMGGNCFGLDLLDWDPDCIDQETIDGYVENDCEFKFNEEDEYYTFTLKDDEGNECEFSCDSDELKDNVIAIEFVDCVVKS